MISEKAKQIPPFIVMDVLERAKELEREGKDIIHLQIGEPDFPTPLSIKEAGIMALSEDDTHYTHSLGKLELREAISEYYNRKYGVTVSPDNILVTMGSSSAMLLLFNALLNPGDEVIISDPGYPCYPNFIHAVDGKAVKVKVNEDKGFQYETEDIRKKLSDRTKGILINSPSNPTGNLLPPERMKEIAGLGKLVISDEIYHGLVYEGKEHSILEFTDNAVVLNGFSKLFAMTGWRLGYVIAPSEFIRPMQKLQQNFFISAPSFAQTAIAQTLNKPMPELEDMKERYDKRRKFLVKSLKEIGFGISVVPTGAFYILANATKFCTDSYKFAFELLENIGVAVTPGIDFGENSEGFIRFSYANSMGNIEKAVVRLDNYLKNK